MVINYDLVIYLNLIITTYLLNTFILDLVLKYLSSSEIKVKEDLKNQLENGLQQIKTIANEYKKQIRVDKVQDS